ncbi:uncharacterized protein METZ01_LOCUS501379, partial [marine metagenome]
MCGDGLGVGRIVEDFHGDIASVADFLQGFRDGFELHFTESGTTQVGIVRVEVGDVRAAFANDVGNSFLLVAHGLYV